MVLDLLIKYGFQMSGRAKIGLLVGSHLESDGD